MAAEGACHQAAMLTKFLFYFSVRDMYKQLNELGTGTTFKELAKGALVKVSKCSLPPLPEQKRIVAILDEAFAGIDRAIANTEKNLVNARELFESYLGAVFTSTHEGWVEKKLGDLFEFKNGINFTKHEKGENGTLTVDVLSMYGDGVTATLGNLYRVNKRISPDYFLQNGDVIFVRSSVKREGVGWPAVFFSNSEPVSFCGFIIRARAFELGQYDPSLLVHYLRQRQARERLVALAKQSTITNISQKTLAGFPVPVPPREEQSRMLGKIEEFVRAKQGLDIGYHQKLRHLSTLKQSILQKAFSGELTAKPDRILAKTGA